MVIKNKYYAFIFLLLLFSFALFPKRVRAQNILSQWFSTSPLPSATASQVSESVQGDIYLMGGSSTITQTHAGVLVGDPIENGNILEWNIDSIIPEPVIWHSSSELNDRFIYVLGGYPDGFNGIYDTIDSVYLSDSYTRPLTWNKTSSIPKRLAGGAAAIVGNRIYYAGGFERTNAGPFIYNLKVYKADINSSDGTLGTWTEAGQLPNYLSGFGMIGAGNKLTVIGGYNPDFNEPQSRVFESTINPDGTLGAWVDKDPLPRPVNRSGITTVGNLVVSVGGVSIDSEFEPVYIDSVYYAQIDNSGSIGEWQTSAYPLPKKLCCGSLAATDTHLYYTGGHDGSYHDTVYYTQVYTAEPTPTPTMDPFDLPFKYSGRPTNNQQIFKNAFWSRLTAAFDHTFTGGVHIPFTGIEYKNKDCKKGTLGISCYDGHNGTDFDTEDQEVYSVASGNVVFASDHNENSCTPNKGGFGCVVIIKYSAQIYGLYAHLDKIFVNKDQNVTVNSKIGEMGNTGCYPCGEHLHFGVLKSLDIQNLLEPLNNQIKRNMSKEDWSNLIYQIQPVAEKPEIGGSKAFCTYKAPNGSIFSFQDPSGWRGNFTDPWSLSKKDKGCEITSPLLWKFALN